MKEDEGGREGRRILEHRRHQSMDRNLVPFLTFWSLEVKKLIVRQLNGDPSPATTLAEMHNPALRQHPSWWEDWHRPGFMNAYTPSRSLLSKPSSKFPRE